MSIAIEGSRFLIRTQKNLYVMEADEHGLLRHVYYGKDIPLGATFELKCPTTAFGESPSKNRSYYHHIIAQEYPVYGRSDFRQGVLHVRNDVHGDTLLNLIYKSYSLSQKTPNIKGQPCVRNTNSPSETLTITLADESLGVSVDLLYTIFEESDVIVRSAVIKNNGSASLELLSALSLALDIPADKRWEMITLNGAWARERKTERFPLTYGIHAISSTQGNSSSNFHNPACLLVRPETTENYGDAIACSLIYSGNHQTQVELNTFDHVRLSIGINPFDFQWHLEPGEIFQTPQAVLCYSDEGIGAVSREMHSFVQQRLIPPQWKDHPRYILLNNWEGTYFDFDDRKIVSMAKDAADLGIELFVLDDGWFGQRNDDKTSLGDWFPNMEKIKSGIGDLSRRVSALGIKFGLWFEPEMISEDSELFRKHPEWRIECPRYKPCQGRNQYVLDLTREEVVDYLYDSVATILKDSDISYVKWDKNRNLTDIMSIALPPQRQKEFTHRYMLGLYRLLDRLTSDFPHILFEGCASGGNRFDLGMLYYHPQIWASDNTDAVQRLDIQWGTSMFYPLASIGSHVSAIPNHQTSRHTSIQLRGAVAMFGTFGYELDTEKISIEDKEIVKQQVKAFKKYRQLIHQGEFHRISDPDTNIACWNVSSLDKSEALVLAVRVITQGNPGSFNVRVPNLIPDALYRIDELGITAYGAELAQMGIWMPMLRSQIKETELSCFCSWTAKEGDPSFADFSGMIFHIIRIK
ncbi:MAG: alpha-galactosidase [Brevinema sp.]